MQAPVGIPAVPTTRAPRLWPTWAIGVVAALIAGLLAAMSGASLSRVAVAIAVIYAAGTIPGSLLVARGAGDETISCAVVRSIAGLLLSTIAFLLSLVLSLRWYVGPVAALVAAIVWRRRAAFALPTARVAFTTDGVVAGLLAVALMSPLVISAVRMAPGTYPPVFFNVDTPYSLEQVHALSRTRVYPPQSLSNVGGRRAYHLGVAGLAALIARTSQLPPHQSLFVIALPLLAVGIVAAAVIAKQQICPTLPSALVVPMLIVTVPSLWYAFWDYIAPRVWLAASTFADAPITAILDNYQMWGVTSIVAQNVGAHFVALAAIAAIAAAPSRGWRLAVFLIGCALIVKSSTGVALLAGLLLAQSYRAVVMRRFQPLMPAVAAAALGAATYFAFWVAPAVQKDYATQLFPMFHLKGVLAREGFDGLALDLLWMIVPALFAIGHPAVDQREGASVPLLLFGLAPLIVVNVTRAIDIRPGAGGATDDWIQVLFPVPLLLHACALSVVGERWPRLSHGRRVMVIAVIAIIVLPAVFVAARYSRVLVRDPARGHEYVDNRSIAAALAAIPRGESIVVTNDLRYPAERFNRDNRQMQIPALFGHQAFAVNYAYEIFGFSRQRRELQRLLQAPTWSDAIEQAARTYHWTHLLIRKDYSHPSSIPLEKMFENESYVVYFFNRSG